MGRNKNKKQSNNQQKRKKPAYKGPYQDNPNLVVQNVKKSMRPEVEGPTVDTFSTLDSTTNMLPSEENDMRQPNGNQKRPTKEKNFFITKEGIILFILGIIATGVGIIVFTYSNKFVGVEKDIDYLKEDFKEQKALVKKVDEKTISIGNKLNLLNQKIDLKKENNR